MLIKLTLWVQQSPKEASIIMFYDYLQDIEGMKIVFWRIVLRYLNCTDGNVFLSTEHKKVQMALEKVLQFITGSSCIPPLGLTLLP